jgi:protoporphyrin/coproporphyrin ferrochelatase
VIGGGSPIRKHTERQAQALEECLAEAGIDATCVVAMRYWHPFTREAIAKLEAAAVEEIVLLPLYPQYSTTTTGSSLNEWNRCFQATSVPVHCVREFYRHETYLQAVVEKVEEALDRFPRRAEPLLVFSAHSVPIAVVEKGDPYQKQIEETVTLVMERGGWRKPHRLCYQSKVGASKWLQPSLRATLCQAAAEGVRQVCVVPISFVSDHVETLGEVDHEAREQAAQLGIVQFEMSAGLNDSPIFIAALGDLVASAIGAPQRSQSARERLVAAD